MDKDLSHTSVILLFCSYLFIRKLNYKISKSYLFRKTKNNMTCMLLYVRFYL